MTTLVITQDYDPTVDPVLALLAQRGHPTLRFDLSDFPSRMRFSSNDFSSSRWLEARGARVDLDAVTAVWYRRPTDFGLDHVVSDDEELDVARTESATAIGGVFRAIDALWVNRPDADEVAGLRPYQLHLARELGLRVPRTVVTNDPEQVRQALATGEHLIYKLLGRGLVLAADELPAMQFTTDISGMEGAALEQVRHAPCLVQELVEKALEVRMTIIGRTVLVATVDPLADPTATLDWRVRVDKGLLYGPPVEPPAPVVEAVVRMMELLGLAFATADFIVTGDGGWVFLELDAQGQFMWLEHDLALPMASTMADLLVDGLAALDRPPEVISA